MNRPATLADKRAGGRSSGHSAPRRFGGKLSVSWPPGLFFVHGHLTGRNSER